VDPVRCDWTQDRYEWCSITLQHKASRAWVDSDQTDGANSGSLRVDDYGLRPGVHQLLADCYFSGDAVDEITIKFGSRSVVTSSSRDGRKVSLKGVVRRWSASDTRFVGWRNAMVKVQRRTTDGWRTVKKVESGRKGHVAVAVTSRRAAKWRLVAAESRSTWSSVSAGIKR
jgi:hypothetical protein